MEPTKEKLLDTEARIHQLMVLSQAGSSSATHELLSALAPRLRAFFRHNGCNNEDSEDLVQETLIAIFTKRAMFNPEQKLLAWVYAIGRYRMIDRWRAFSRRGHHIHIDDVEHVLESEQHEAGDPKRDIAKLLATLPSKQRRVLELVKLQDMSIQEAAIATGWTPSDIKISIHRGLKSLMALVGELEPNILVETRS